jgi:isoleucyl-tRNA synthetase
MVTDRRPMQEAVRQVLMPIWNAWYFLSLYANAAGTRGTSLTAPPTGALDRYAIAKVRELRDDVTARMDAYDLSGACAAILAFLDSLNNWYIRRSRDRFWRGEQDAIDTLHTVLGILCRVAAPLLPLTTEAIYRGLTGADSVHLTDWPAPDEAAADAELVAAMDAVRDVCSAASSVRKARGIPNRQPLRSLTVAAPDAAALGPFTDLIADEANVKQVELSTDVAAAGEHVLALVPAVLGPRVGSEVQQLIKAAKAGEWSRRDGTVEVAGRALAEDEFTLRLVARDEAASSALPDDRGLVTLDLVITPELEAEGLVREVIRHINELRKTDGLHVSDRIRLVLSPGHHRDVRSAVESHRDAIAGEVLATELVIVDDELVDAHRIELRDGRALRVRLERSPFQPKTEAAPG